MLKRRISNQSETNIKFRLVNQPTPKALTRFIVLSERLCVRIYQMFIATSALQDSILRSLRQPFIEFVEVIEECLLFVSARRFFKQLIRSMLIYVILRVFHTEIVTSQGPWRAQVESVKQQLLEIVQDNNVQQALKA